MSNTDGEGNGALLDEEETQSLACLPGIHMPFFEMGPQFTVGEVLNVGVSIRTVWCQLAEHKEQPLKYIWMFITPLGDALHREGDVNKVVSLGRSMVAADPRFG